MPDCPTEPGGGSRLRRARAASSAATVADQPLSSGESGKPARSLAWREGVHRQYAVRHRGRLVQRDPGQAVGHRLAHVVEVGRLAPDDHAQRDHRVEAGGPGPARPRAARPSRPPVRRSPRLTPHALAAASARSTIWSTRSACQRVATMPSESPAASTVGRSGSPKPAISSPTPRQWSPGRPAGGPSGRAWCVGSAGSPGAAARAATPAR